jgi:hypothetical protein
MNMAARLRDATNQKTTIFKDNSYRKYLVWTPYTKYIPPPIEKILVSIVLVVSQIKVTEIISPLCFHFVCFVETISNKYDINGKMSI